MTPFKVAGFTIMAFPVVHNVPTVGYLIQHSEMGLLLFATDTAFIGNRFEGLNQIMIEANYDDPLLHSDHAVGRHMSLDTCVQFIKANDTKKVRNIVLLHLSSGNSDAKQFQETVSREVPGANVYVADKGLEIELKKEPF